ncbi:MAG: glucose 1-dehydrogenase, partial [Proteobacteria bacterium]|nr:glucose 1-dehydrogenase [Pseudomonadota bacterium]
MRLKDKVAIVTGAGSGFGEGIARRFVEEGAHVVVADIDEDAGTRVAGDIENAEFRKTDVTDGAQVKAMFEAAERCFGGLDILVNNAGFPQRRMPMLEVTEEVFDRIYAVNVKSIYLAAIHGVPMLRRRGGGVIINTASTAAVSPRPGLTWYNGSKGAVVTLTKSMAVELAPDDLDRRVPPTRVPATPDNHDQSTLTAGLGVVRTLWAMVRAGCTVGREWQASRVLAVYPHRCSMLAGWWIARRLGVPLVLYMHDLCAEAITFRNPPRRWFWSIIDRVCLQRAALVIVPTDEFAAHYEQRGVTRTWVLPHCVGGVTQASDPPTPREKL